MGCRPPSPGRTFTLGAFSAMPSPGFPRSTKFDLRFLALGRIPGVEKRGRYGLKNFEKISGRGILYGGIEVVVTCIPSWAGKRGTGDRGRAARRRRSLTSGRRWRPRRRAGVETKAGYPVHAVQRGPGEGRGPLAPGAREDKGLGSVIPMMVKPLVGLAGAAGAMVQGVGTASRGATGPGRCLVHRPACLFRP